MIESRARSTGLLLLAALVASGPAAAEPMRLDDATPRWVWVQFEVSPPDRPAQLDSVYTRPLRAWLEPADEAGRIRVSVDGARVEQFLLASETAVPGSFGSFDWIFDSASGEVVSAELVGRLVKTLDWGLFRTPVEAPIRATMDTHTPAGFRPARHHLGQLLFRYCEQPGRGDCTGVAPVPYDRHRGYVNAVGPLAVEFEGMTLRTFSPLGEALFSEIPAGDAGESEAQIARQP